MSTSGGSDPFGFGKFIPGFEFLQGLSQGAGAAGADAPLAAMAQWVAPTVSVEDIDKRIKELRAVQFWIEQNGRALTATIQALEVQKMTLAALQSMQGGINEWAKATPLKATPFKMPEAAAAPAPSTPPPAPATPPPAASAPAADPTHGAVDPLQWWGALTQQFQQIAAQAMQEPAHQKAMEAGTQMAGEFARGAMQSAADLAKAAEPAPAPASDEAPAPQGEPAAPVAKPARKTPRRAS
ncbi:MAG: PhaM family polyhydroxyalkanoate granule multifunctional regulatory protein [Comamonas sp.]